MPYLFDPQEPRPRSLGAAAHSQDEAHTPTPWTLDAGKHRAWICRIGNNSDDPEIWCERAVKPGELYPFGDKLADAAFIVRACNAHDELVKTLEVARECIAYCRRAHKDVQSGEGFPVEVIIDAALAKARA